MFKAEKRGGGRERGRSNVSCWGREDRLDLDEEDTWSENE